MLFQKLLSSSVRPRGNVSFVVGASADAQTITIPAGVQSGDLLMFCDMAADSALRTVPAAPSGWTTIIDEASSAGSPSTGGAQRARVFVRVADGTESGTVLTGTNWATVTGARRKMVVVFRTSLSRIFSFVFGGYTFAYSTGVPASQTVTPPINYFPTITFGLFRGTSAFTATFSPSNDGSQNGGSNAAQLLWRLNNTNNPSVTLSAPDSGALTYVGGFFLELR
jgi:hypothetical protein